MDEEGGSSSTSTIAINQEQMRSQETITSGISEALAQEYPSPKDVKKANIRFSKAVEELDTLLIYNWIIQRTRRVHLSSHNVHSALFALVSEAEPKKKEHKDQEAEFRDLAVRAILNECGTGLNLECIDDKFMATPLILAAARGRRSITELLIDKKANLKAKDGIFGRTALSWAARNNFPKTAGVLLKALEESGEKETIHFRDDKGQTAVDLAREKGNDDMVGLLMRYEASWKV